MAGVLLADDEEVIGARNIGGSSKIYPKEKEPQPLKHQRTCGPTPIAIRGRSVAAVATVAHRSPSRLTDSSEMCDEAALGMTARPRTSSTASSRERVTVPDLHSSTCHRIGRGARRTDRHVASRTRFFTVTAMGYGHSGGIGVTSPRLACPADRRCALRSAAENPRPDRSRRHTATSRIRWHGAPDDPSRRVTTWTFGRLPVGTSWAHRAHVRPSRDRRDGPDQAQWLRDARGLHGRLRRRRRRRTRSTGSSPAATCSRRRRIRAMVQCRGR